VLQYCAPLQWCTMVQAVLTGRSTGLGFDLAWFSFLPNACVSAVFMVLYVYMFQFFVTFFYFTFQ